MQRLLPIAMIAAVALVLVAPAIWNGFALVYSDTGAYLATAFEGKLPMARPTGYGLFIRYTSFGGHLWLTLLAQGLLFAGLLYRTVRVALPQAVAWQAYLPAACAAVGLTGMAWYASTLMPDIFTGLVALLFFLILFDPQARWWGRLGYAGLAYAFCFAHYSHTALLLGLSGGAACLWLGLAGFRKLRRQTFVPPFAFWRLAWAIIPVGLTIFSYAYVNQANGLGWRITRSSHVFTMARLSETGLLQEYLHETCGYKQWSLCPYADSLPDNAAAFIWNDDSPFKKTGYWDNSRPQYDSLLADFFKRGHYLKQYLKVSLASGMQQLCELNVGDGLTPYNESSSPYKFFERAMPSQVPGYMASKQFARELQFGWERKLLDWTMILSPLLLLGALVWRGRRLPLHVWAWVLVAAASYVINAFVTGAFANVYARLQARIAWVIPLACCLVVVELIRQAKSKTPSN